MTNTYTSITDIYPSVRDLLITDDEISGLSDEAIQQATIDATGTLQATERIVWVDGYDEATDTVWLGDQGFVWADEGAEDADPEAVWDVLGKLLTPEYISDLRERFPNE